MSALAEPQQVTIEELVATVNREHTLAMQASRAVLGHAIKAGEALLEIQQQVAHGEWKAWVDANVSMHWSTANDYMRVAHFREELDGMDRLDDAITFLRGRVRNPDRPGRAGKLDLRNEALRLHKAGSTGEEIERRLGVSATSVYRWTNPEKDRQYTQAAKARNEDARRYREQKSDRKVSAAIRKQGGAMAELYAMAERMQDVIAQAHREAEGKEARKALSLAGMHYRRMRDEIVKGALT